MKKKKINKEIASIEARQGSNSETNNINIYIDDTLRTFINRGVTPEDLRLFASLLGGEINLKDTKVELEITDGMMFVLGYVMAEEMGQYNAPVGGDQFAERFANAVVKTVHLAKSADGKQRRSSLSLVKLLRNSAGWRKSRNINNRVFSEFSEIVEEFPTPRKGKKVRVQPERGRPKGSGGYKQSDRELLLKFRDEHGRLPKFDAEYKALAEVACGKDSGHAYDRSSTISRLRRAATSLRRE